MVGYLLEDCEQVIALGMQYEQGQRKREPTARWNFNQSIGGKVCGDCCTISTTVPYRALNFEWKMLTYPRKKVVLTTLLFLASYQVVYRICHQPIIATKAFRYLSSLSCLRDSALFIYPALWMARIEAGIEWAGPGAYLVPSPKLISFWPGRHRNRVYCFQQGFIWHEALRWITGALGEG